jgi:hypothetical protein
MLIEMPRCGISPHTISNEWLFNRKKSLSICSPNKESSAIHHELVVD